MGADTFRLPLFSRDEEHGIGLLVVSLEPAQYFLRGVGCDKHFQSSLRHPLAGMSPEQVGLMTLVRPSARCHIDLSSFVRVASPTDHETQTPENAASVMGGEVCPIQSSDEAYHLLRRIAATPHNDEMVRQWFGKHPAHRALDCPALKNEVVVSDGRMYLIHFL